jgi:hypothetical protein
MFVVRRVFRETQRHLRPKGRPRVKAGSRSRVRRSR